MPLLLGERLGKELPPVPPDDAHRHGVALDAVDHEAGVRDRELGLASARAHHRQITGQITGRSLCG
jgi:hypothetical protein